MAEPIAPISDEALAHLESIVAFGFGVSLDKVTAAMVLARLSAEQRRGNEEFNAGVEAAAQRLLNGSFLHDDAPTARFAREAAPALRALKRPIPTKEDTNRG